MPSYSLPVGVTVDEMEAAMAGHQDEPKRARVKGGRFRADDPATPETDEAWEKEN